MRARPSAEKRRKEAARRERKAQKAERRAARRESKDSTDPSEPGTTTEAGETVDEPAPRPAGVGLGIDTGAEGERWAAEVRSRTIEENRRATGGWPGTMTEARARVAGLAGRLAPGEFDREEAAHAIYAGARRWWTNRQERGEEEA